MHEQDSDEFLLHLISNAQPELYANKANHFKTLMDSPINIPSGEKWEVGLKEFGYVNNVDTVTRPYTINFGKIFNTHLLQSYFPHYTLEGGSKVEKHYLETVGKSYYYKYLNTLYKVQSSAIVLEKTKKTTFYAGSNATTEKKCLFHSTEVANFL